jgi:hypothetical protein
MVTNVISWRYSLTGVFVDAVHDGVDRRWRLVCNLLVLALLPAALYPVLICPRKRVSSVSLNRLVKSVYTLVFLNPHLSIFFLSHPVFTRSPHLSCKKIRTIFLSSLWLDLSKKMGKRSFEGRDTQNATERTMLFEKISNSTSVHTGKELPWKGSPHWEF